MLTNTMCQKCGKTNSGGYSTCPHCGANALVNQFSSTSQGISDKNVTSNEYHNILNEKKNKKETKI